MYNGLMLTSYNSVVDMFFFNSALNVSRHNGFVG